MNDTTQPGADNALDLDKLEALARAITRADSFVSARAAYDAFQAEATANNVLALIALARRAAQPVEAAACAVPPEGWEPVYLAWNETASAWVDVGLAEYEAAEKPDRRIAYQPKAEA